MISLVASASSFAEGSMLLQNLAGLTVPVKSVERVGKQVGSSIGQDETATVESGENPSQTMYLGVDGTGIPMCRQELAGRNGKQADGLAKTREVKECVIWTADSQDKDGHPKKDEGSASYSAAIESCAWPNAGISDEIPPFASRVVREMQRTGYNRAARQVFIGDGAAWIWNLANMVAPQAIQIIDLYHAKEHLSNLAAAIFGQGQEMAKQWACQRHVELEQGRLDLVLKNIGEHKLKPDEVGAKAAVEFDYFCNNSHRMRYAYFKSLGLCVGSGVVEAGCKHVIGQRLKRSGMFWSLDGANCILALRCSVMSGRFDDYWQRYLDKAKSRSAKSRSA